MINKYEQIDEHRRIEDASALPFFYHCYDRTPGIVLTSPSTIPLMKDFNR